MEIKYQGSWGTICDDRFDINDAIVVCKQIGFTTAISFYTSPFEGSGNIWLDEVRCSGSEPFINACSHAGWGIHDCSHSEDIAVTCR